MRRAAPTAPSPSGTPPPPNVVGIQEDSAGLVWLFVRLAAPGWRDGWRNAGRRGREIEAQDMEPEKLFRTVIEVIDPEAARVVARASLNEWVIEALPGLRAATRVRDGDGVVRIPVLGLTLTGR